MSQKHHQFAVVHPDATIGDNVVIEPFAVVEANVIIGNGCWIGSGAIVKSGTHIGNDCKIHHGAVVGGDPQDLSYKGENTTLVVGNRTIIREFCTLNRGTAKDPRMMTKVGDDCLLMAYSHVAHDCFLGDHVILSNAVNLAGHITIDDYAIIGGMCAVSQFMNIGAHAFIVGGSMVHKEVPPFAYVGREPLTYLGVNSIGLARRGFSTETIENIRKAYRIIYSNPIIKKGVQEALTAIDLPETQLLAEFINNSKYGIIRENKRIVGNSDESDT